MDGHSLPFPYAYGAKYSRTNMPIPDHRRHLFTPGGVVVRFILR